MERDVTQSQIERIDADKREIVRDMGERFGKIDARLDKIDARIGAIELGQGKQTAVVAFVGFIVGTVTPFAKAILTAFGLGASK